MIDETTSQNSLAREMSRSVEQVRTDAHNWRATVLAWTYKLAAAAMR